MQPKRPPKALINALQPKSHQWRPDGLFERKCALSGGKYRTRLADNDELGDPHRRREAGRTNIASTIERGMRRNYRLRVK